MSRHASPIIPPIPHSNEDMLLLGKSSILNPLIESDCLRNTNNKELNKRYSDLQREVNSVLNDQLVQLIKPKGKEPMKKSEGKWNRKLIRRDISMSLGGDINKELLNRIEAGLRKRMGSKDKHKDNDNNNNKDRTIERTNKGYKRIFKQRRKNSMTTNNSKGKEAYLSLWNNNTLGLGLALGRNNNNTNVNDKEIISIDKLNSQLLIKNTKPNAYCNNYFDYILSSPRKHKKPQINTRNSSITLDHIPIPFSNKQRKSLIQANKGSISNLNINININTNTKTLFILKQNLNKKNQSMLYNTTASTNAGFNSNKTTSKRPSLNSNASMDKLRASLSEASKQLVSELCIINRDYYDSYKEAKVKTLEMLDKEHDLEGVLDIKVDYRNKKQIGSELNKRLYCLEDLDYKSAVVDFSRRVINYNPESTLKLADRIRDEYNKRTGSGKYNKRNVAIGLHDTEMRRVKSQMKLNEHYIRRIWKDYERIKEKKLTKAKHK